MSGSFETPSGADDASPPWLLCDYGEVLCDAQPEDEVRSLGLEAGVSEEDFASRYWSLRPAYDEGALSGVAYWEGVCGAILTEERLERLLALDLQSWSHLRPDALDAVNRARERGFRLALLSNAPSEIARGVELLPALSIFEHLVFSCDVRAVKPGPAIYAHVLTVLDASPSEVIFIDDRAENVEGAHTCGITAFVYGDASQLDELELRPSR